MINLSLRWQSMTQDEIYRKTNEPKPHEALKKGNTDKFHLNSAAYTFSNEPAKTLESIMDYQGKKGLGVAASGDQAFTLLQLGLREYLAFDISQIACYWVELKRAAILNLSQKEFLNFVSEKSKDKKTYSQLRKHLTPYTKHFFDEAVKNKKSIGELIHDWRFFRGDYFNKISVTYTANKKDYQRTKEILSTSPFKIVWEGIDQAMELTPNEQYDVIFISNILDRWEQFDKSFTKTLKLMKKRLAPGADSRIIGNYQLGEGVAKNIQKAANKTGLLFTQNCEEANKYWTLQHKKESWMKNIF